MDFKVAGTKDGITAIQVDIKNDGLSYDIIEEAFERTLKARTMIIDDIMNKAIATPREHVSEYAPKIEKVQISIDKIRDLIGTGGKNINKIIEETGVEIDIQETGLVLVYGQEQENMDKAIAMIKILTKEFKVGEIVEGVVTNISKFGAFVDLGVREGLVHISKIVNRRINTVEEVLKVGDYVKAKIIEIDNYKEVFSSNNQDFHLQKLGQKLILASNKPNMIYEGAVVCESFKNDNFYYTSSIINCVYDCEYCYLQGVYSSGNIVIFVDIEKVFEEVEELYNKLKTLYLCVSYDTDLLAIENICGFSEKWYHFIEDKKYLKIELRTKSGNIDKFLNLKPLDNFIIAFTLSPENLALKNEKYTASFKNRVKAIKELQEKGWKVRICIDPLIYSDNFEKNYSQMIEYLFNEIDKEKVIDISIGVFRISKEYLKKMRNQNQNSEILYYPFECIDGVYSYSDKTKSYMINFIKEQFLKYININKIYM